MSSQTYVLCAVEAGVATLTLNEPKARNPLSPQLVRELTEHLRDCTEDADIRAVVLVGAGKGFSAGADLRRMRSARPLEDRDEYNDILALNRLLWTYPKPTVAAVHGFALGAGANLVSWCDIAVIDAAARIAYPEVRAGVPSATVIPALMRTVGRKRMYELVLTGDSIGAHEALSAGLVSRVAEVGTAYDEAVTVARTIAGHDPSAVALTKEIVHTTADMPFESAIVYAKEVRVIARLREDFAVRVPQGAGHHGCRS